MYLKNLIEITRKEASEYGFKTVNLAAIASAGYWVPEGYGLSTSAFSLFRDFNQIDLQNFPENIRESIGAGEFPEDLEDSIRQAWDRISTGLGGPALIVRSSAIGEDGEQHTFAGVYESVLNVRSRGDLKTAIKKCWAAYFSDPAVQYREKAGFHDGAMSILIQRMVEGNKSGVLFTMDPVTGDRERMMIEAYPGLNFVVVDGSAPVDRFVTDHTGKLTSQVIGTKKIKYTLGQKSYEIKTEAIEPALWNEAALSEAEMRDLAAVAGNLESLFHHPCDIEWTMKDGQIYILQCRPIVLSQTAAAWAEAIFNCDIPPDVECSLLDRYSEPVCVCYLSLLQSWEELVYLSFYRKTEGKHYEQKPLLFYFNRVYWNLKYQREFFDDVPFGLSNPGEASKKLKLLYLLLFGARSWYRRIPRYERQLRKYVETELHDCNLPELRNLLAGLIRVFCNYIGKDHYRFLGLAQVSYNLLAASLEGMEEQKEVISSLMESGVSDNMTMKSNYELINLAKAAKECPEVLEVFMSVPAARIYDLLGGSQPKREFKRKFDEFIGKHGHRGTSCDDLYSPHWVEKPEMVLEIIRQFVSNPADLLEIGLKNRGNPLLRYREAINEYLKQCCPNGFRRIWRKRKLETLAGIAAKYMALRENQRYYFDKSWVLIRRIILEIGARLAGEKILLEAEGIFHLTVDEIFLLSGGNGILSNTPWQKAVESRKSALQKNAKITPPYLIKNNALHRIQGNTAKRSYKAVGISQGKACGQARIISGLKDLSKVKPGEIVVVSTFHPSWTPVLGLAGGLVMNYGNILSHGAVVAREYGIPVVVFNDMATQVFTDGQWLEINGITGRIRVLDEFAAQENLQETV